MDKELDKEAELLRKLKILAIEILLFCETGRDPVEIAKEAEDKIIDIVDSVNQRGGCVHISQAVMEAIEWEDEDRMNSDAKTRLKHARHAKDCFGTAVAALKKIDEQALQFNGDRMFVLQRIVKFLDIELAHADKIISDYEKQYA